MTTITTLFFIKDNFSHVMKIQILHNLISIIRGFSACSHIFKRHFLHYTPRFSLNIRLTWTYFHAEAHICYGHTYKCTHTKLLQSSFHYHEERIHFIPYHISHHTSNLLGTLNFSLNKDSQQMQG